MTYKLLNHCFSIKKDLPITLSVCLTGRCNLNCSFCYINKRKREDLDLNILNSVLKNPVFRGKVKSVEFGMGEPTLYPQINEAIELCSKKYFLSIGLGTNGTCLFNITPDNLKRIDWMNLSITNYIDNGKYINWSFIPNKINFIYVLHKKSPKPEVLEERFNKFLEVNKSNNLEIKLDINTKDNDLIGVFYYMKYFLHLPYKFTDPHGKFKLYEGTCHYVHLKPLLNNDGWLYGCCVAVENGDYPEWNRICRWDEIDEKFYSTDTYRCCNKCSKAERLNIISKFKQDDDPDFII